MANRRQTASSETDHKRDMLRQAGSSRPWWIAGSLLAIAVALIVSVLMVQTATSAGLTTTNVANLRGALSLDGLSPAFLQGSSVQVIPVHPLRTALVVVHIIGLTLGMGSALFLDLFLISRLYARRIDCQTTDLLVFGSRLVSGGLALLWASGLGLLAFYYVVAPFALENPKLIAKVAVVCALTVNGALLHNIVMPMANRRLGKPLLAGLPLSQAILPIAIGVTSGVSWAFCCLLGLIKELNGVVPAQVLLGGYLAVLVLGIAAASAVHVFFQTRSRFVPSL